MPLTPRSVGSPRDLTLARRYTANVAAGSRDPLLTPYRTLLAYGAVGIVIFIAGFFEFIHFEPFQPGSGAQAHISGVFKYDPSTKTTTGPDRATFARGDQFAAVVDWSSLPDNLSVEAIWYDSFENIVGSVGPGTPSGLRDQTTVPAAVPEGLKYHLPGQYIFAVERIAGGRPVEVLGRRIVFVDRT